MTEHIRSTSENSWRYFAGSSNITDKLDLSVQIDLFTVHELILYVAFWSNFYWFITDIH